MAEHWHRCQRWTERNLPCPLRHEETEEDDDDDEEDPVPVETPVPIKPGIPLVERKARTTATQQAAVQEAIEIVSRGVPQPVPEPTGGVGQFVSPPLPITPIPKVPRTQSIPTGGTGFQPGAPVGTGSTPELPGFDAMIPLLLAAFTVGAFFFRSFGPGPVRLAAGAALLGMAAIEAAFTDTLDARVQAATHQQGSDMEGPDPLAGSNAPIAAALNPPLGQGFLVDMSQRFVRPQFQDVPTFTDR